MAGSGPVDFRWQAVQDLDAAVRKGTVAQLRRFRVWSRARAASPSPDPPLPHAAS